MTSLPYVVLPAKLLVHSRLGKRIGNFIGPFFPATEGQLEQADSDFNAKEYLGACALSDILLFLLFGIIIGLPMNFVWGYALSLVLTIFIFTQQLFYPQLVVKKRQGAIEKNLLPALQDMRVQITAGIAMFDVLKNISESKYGAVSEEAKKAVQRISAGANQTTVIEELADCSPSLFFRRAMWQISNGMHAGADIRIVLDDIINTLSEEQVIQLQSYGGQLNPIIMLYMILGIIMPALGVTFVVVISTFVRLSEFTITAIFIGLYVAFALFQLLFLNLVKAKRPNLL